MEEKFEDSKGIIRVRSRRRTDNTNLSVPPLGFTHVFGEFCVVHS
jgi:hypothetical protein